MNACHSQDLWCLQQCRLLSHRGLEINGGKPDSASRTWGNSIDDAGACRKFLLTTSVVSPSIQLQSPSNDLRCVATILGRPTKQLQVESDWWLRRYTRKRGLRGMIQWGTNYDECSRSSARRALIGTKQVVSCFHGLQLSFKLSHTHIDLTVADIYILGDLDRPPGLSGPGGQNVMQSRVPCNMKYMLGR